MTLLEASKALIRKSLDERIPAPIRTGIDFVRSEIQTRFPTARILLGALNGHSNGNHRANGRRRPVRRASKPRKAPLAVALAFSIPLLGRLKSTRLRIHTQFKLEP